MKTLKTLAVLLMLGLSVAIAQVPNGIKYQAVARDVSGQILPNTNIRLRLTVVDSAAGGTAAFTESHKIRTNPFGLMSVTLGKGDITVGSFSGIPWSTGNKWLRVEMDPTGGTNFITVGMSELMAVPYALFSGNSQGDDSDQNELVGNVTFDSGSNELSIIDAGGSKTVIIDKEADDLSDNVLNDLGDVNTAPSLGQVLKWNGSEWIAGSDATNDQILSINNNILTISNGNSVDLTGYLDNSDDQQITFNTSTNILTLEDGGTVDLSSLVAKGVNTSITYDSTTNTLTVTDGSGSQSVKIDKAVNDADADPINELNTLVKLDGTNLEIEDAGGTKIADLSSLIDDADADPGNELNTSVSLNGNNIEITDAGGTKSVDLSPLIDDADANPTNELNITAVLNGTNLEITDAGGTLSVDLSSLIDDADADPTNEFNNNVILAGNVLQITDGGGTKTVDLSSLINDADADPSNELLISAVLNISTLELTDAGGKTTVDLSPLINDADANPTNEFNTSVLLNGTDLEITDAGGTKSADLSGLIDDADADTTNELQVLSRSGLDVSLSLGGGTVSVADNDNDSTNELITGATLTGTDLEITDAGGTSTIDLSSLVDDVDADTTNELQNLSISNDTVSISDGNSIVLPAEIDGDPSNELNTAVVLNGTDLEITDAGGTKSADLSSLIDDADADTTNELQSLSISNDTVSISDGNSIVLPAELDGDATNELNTTVVLNGTDLEITDAGGTKSADLSSLIDDADADTTNELQSLSISNDTVSISDGNSIVLPAEIDGDPSNELNTAVVLNGTDLEITDAGGTKSADLSSLVDDADADTTNELQSLSISNDTVSISDGNSIVLPAEVDGDATNELNTTVVLNGTDLEITDAGGTKSADLSSLVNDADADTTNELQSLSISNDTVSISNGNSIVLPAEIDGDATNELNTTVALNGTDIEITDAGGTKSADLSSLIDDADADATNELQTLALSNDTLSISNGNLVVLPPDADSDSTNELQDLTDQELPVLRLVTIKITNGTNTTFSIYDGDSSMTNELITGAVLSGTDLEITDAGGTTSIDLSSLIDDADPDATNEFQNLTINNDTLVISDGNFVILPSGADTNSTNELQNLSLSNDTLTISNGNSVAFTDFLVDGDVAGGDLTGTYPNPSIASGAVGTTELADNSVSTAKIIDFNVTSSKLGNSSVISTKIATDAVTNGKIADDAVTSAKITDGTIVNGDVAAGAAIDFSKLNIVKADITGLGIPGSDTDTDNQSLWETIVGDAGATTANSTTDSLTVSGGAGIETAVSGDDITIAVSDGGISTVKLADDAVTSTKINDGTIVNDDVSAGAAIAFSKLNIVKSDITGLGIPGSDADPDSTNELQTLTLSNDTLTISDGNSVSGLIISGASAGGDLTGTYPNPSIANDVITSANIVDVTITSDDIASDAIISAKLATGAVTTTKLQDSGVTTTKLADNAVTTDKIAAGAVDSTEIADGSVISADLADGSVTTAKLADDAVTTAKILDFNVTSAKLGNSSVTSTKLASGSVTDVKIADGAVITSKLDSLAVTTEKINVKAVTTQKIADYAINSLQLAGQCVNSTKIATKAVTNGKLDTLAVTSDKIANEAVTSVKLDSNLTLKGSVAIDVKSIDDTDSPYTAADEVVILANATSGAITVNLPTASSVTGRIYTIKKIDNSVNAVTVNANTDVIDGSTTQSLPNQWDFYKIVSDGSDWFIIGQ